MKGEAGHRARLRLLLTVLLFAAVACSDGHSGLDLCDDGVCVRLSLEPFQIQVLNRDDDVVLSTALPGGSSEYGPLSLASIEASFSPNILPGWFRYSAKQLRPWARIGAATLVSRSSSSASLELAAADEVVALQIIVAHGRVRLDWKIREGSDANLSSIAFELPADEHFFGLGERFASLDHRGLSLYCWAEEVGLGAGEGIEPGPSNPAPNGWSMTGFPMPFVHSSRGYAIHLETTSRSVFHLGSERPDAWRMEVNSGEAQTTIYVHDDPLTILDQFTEDAGRPPVPAPWVFGPRRRVSPDQQVNGEQEWKLLRQRGVPTTGIDDAVHFLPHRSELGRQQELEQWTSELHDNGFKVMAYNTPYVSMTDSRAAEDLAHGAANGYFVKDADGEVAETFFISGKAQTLATIDLTHAEAQKWFKSLLGRTLALGYDGWMHDFGEYIQADWQFSDGRSGEQMHNLFPVLSARAAFELLQEERPDDYLFFVRSGYTGTQAVVPAVWGSDPEATFDTVQGLPAALRAGINLGLSGVPYWGSDISGFKCLTDDPRDKEVYLRWAQVGAVSPIMMDQNACSSGMEKREKWTLWSDQETTEVYGKLARLHTRLSPYFQILAAQASQTGAPLMRHPFLTHPRDPQSWQVDDAFFLGPALFAAPVVRRGERIKKVWLPPGQRYVDLDDYTVYQGGEVASIEAPLTKLPLLLSENQLLPLLDESIETLAPATVSTVVTPEQVKDRLDVVVALGPGGQAELTLIDGTRLSARRAVKDRGIPAGLEQVAPEQLPDCSACYHRAAQGQVERLRVSTAGSEISIADVELSASAGPARRIRWDVLLLR